MVNHCPSGWGGEFAAVLDSEAEWEVSLDSGGMRLHQS
jgi:hypothetical protein